MEYILSLIAWQTYTLYAVAIVLSVIWVISILGADSRLDLTDKNPINSLIDKSHTTTSGMTIVINVVVCIGLLSLLHDLNVYFPDVPYVVVMLAMATSVPSPAIYASSMSWGLTTQVAELDTTGCGTSNFNFVGFGSTITLAVGFHAMLLKGVEFPIDFYINSNMAFLLVLIIWGCFVTRERVYLIDSLLATNNLHDVVPARTLYVVIFSWVHLLMFTLAPTMALLLTAFHMVGD